MIPPDMTSDLHEAFNIVDNAQRRLKNIITPMEDTGDNYYRDAHAILLVMINDAKNTLDDIVVRAESLTVKPKRP